MSSNSPPTVGGAIEELPTKWPTVVGVISIVMASLGLLCGCAGFFAVPMQKWGVEMQQQANQSNPVAEAQLRIAEQYQYIMFGLLAVVMALTLWLLFASISLLRRRRSARSGMIGWAIASLFMLALNIGYQIMIFQATAAELDKEGHGDRMAEVWLAAGFGACFGVVFGAAFQVFILVWFNRTKIKNEMARWP